MIISYVCKIRPDHCKVNWVGGCFQINSVVQDHWWNRELVVIRSRPENNREVVAECIGQDQLGHRITHVLVVDKCWLDGLCIPLKSFG